MDTMSKMQEEVTQNTELHHYILETFGLQSKKKRVRKKLLKQVISQEKVLKKLVSEFKNTDQEQPVVSRKEEVSTVSFEKLPVTTLLKIGKEFFKEEESVRFYYNKNKEPFYKNKEMLIACISTNYAAAPADIQKEIITKL
ncbi:MULTISPECIES: hypothetical protein [Niallia]|jgi:hypothetical protein|uniref:Uncharacterized protein n=2 Tax=Niallia TaxID=2837506 RepID=A0AA91TT28_NIACI|nr:hypothetical protein [Niallia circulans]AYV71633.1 hypothetical protein C2H98_08575 [Niallia circulans]NRG29028.1 hypothetical protein [Niallia circulans]PAD83537.1 hypothetical protein CHH57_09140 [Niallia circulans]QJX61446.1 hypothetical protein HLK66_07125 [Niallia circulans]UQZ74000.1 hypothetical protein C2I17_05140 [Niallia circulans]